MIPNIFVSSTVSDLQYLRDGLREAIEELAYRPVMSEFGEIGYLSRGTAADACYATVPQCQMMVLIIGLRYGSLGEDGLSVTHREYRAARDASLPTISFVDPKVLAYRDVFQVSQESPHWKSFQGMDCPEATFNLIGEISDARSYNAILPFVNVRDAKRQLKLQIANFVGDQLSDAVSPSAQFVKEVLAEVKTIRNQLEQSEAFRADIDRSRRFFSVARFLLDDAALGYRDFLKAIYQGLDSAIAALPDCATVEDVVRFAKHELRIVSRDEIKWKDADLVHAHFSEEVWAIDRSGTVLMTEGQQRRFNALQTRLRRELVPISGNSAVHDGSTGS